MATERIKTSEGEEFDVIDDAPDYEGGELHLQGVQDTLNEEESEDA